MQAPPDWTVRRELGHVSLQAVEKRKGAEGFEGPELESLGPNQSSPGNTRKNFLTQKHCPDPDTLVSSCSSAHGRAYNRENTPIGGQSEPWVLNCSARPGGCQGQEDLLRSTVLSTCSLALKRTRADAGAIY